jgi:hypothetical protein
MNSASVQYVFDFAEAKRRAIDILKQRVELERAHDELTAAAEAFDAVAEARQIEALKAEIAMCKKEVLAGADDLQGLLGQAKAARKKAAATPEAGVLKRARENVRIIDAAIRSEERRLADGIAGGSK